MRRVLAAVGVVLLASCVPQSQPDDRVDVLGFHVEGDLEQPLTTATYALELSDPPSVSTRRIRLQNVGKRRVVIGSIEQTEGSARFSLDLVTPLTLDPGVDQLITATFRNDAPQPTIEAASFVLHVTTPRAFDGTLRLQTVVADDCAFPALVDFGAVQIGSKSTRSVVFRNAHTFSIEGEARAIRGDGAFTSMARELSIPAMNSEQLGFEFAPTEPRGYSATVLLRRSEFCEPKQVTLSGQGVASCVSASCGLNGTPCRFGNVEVGQHADLSVTFTNLCDPMQISDVMTTNPAFSIVEPASMLERTATLTVRFTPTQRGAATGQLTLTTPFAPQSHLELTLVGMGGAPSLVLDRTALDLGLMGYFPNAVTPAWVDAELTVGNATNATAPLEFEVAASSADGRLGELCVGTWSTDGCAALPRTTLAPGATTNIPIRITPDSLGIKAFNLLLRSNEPSGLGRLVRVSVDAQLLPPCIFDVSPTALNFGVVGPGETREQTLTLRNRGTQDNDDCHVNGLRLAAGSDSAFSLVGERFQNFVVPPNGQHAVLVRFTGDRLPPGQRNAKVVFAVSSPTSAKVSLPVTADVGQ